MKTERGTQRGEWWRVLVTAGSAALMAGCSTGTPEAVGKAIGEVMRAPSAIVGAAPESAMEMAADLAEPAPEVAPAPVARSMESAPAMSRRAMASGGAAADSAPFKTQRVFYGTNRKTGDTSDPNKFYSGARADRLEVGYCDVSIPRTHQPGQLEAPDPLSWEYWIAGGFREDPKKHVVLMKVKPEDRASFVQDFQRMMRAESDGKKRCFVFVHGYNVPFRTAARRTAQMAHDLGFPGVPAFFSWPSQGGQAYYLVDADNNLRSRPELRDFLEIIARDSGAQEIHLIAHSMGTRVTGDAVPDVYAKLGPFTRPRLKSIILAAPDIDAEVFNNDIVPRLQVTGIPLTLYASRSDKALQLARQMTGKKRIGEDPLLAVGRTGIDVIDASAVKTDFTDHSYFGQSPALLLEFRSIFDGKKPDQRTWLLPKTSSAGARYWVLPARD